jgi:hypothetical protein
MLGVGTMSEIDDNKPQRRRPRGRPPTYASDLDKLVITVCGGLIRRPDKRPGTALDSPESQRWWKAFHWWLKDDPEALRARLRLSEKCKARPSLTEDYGSEYGPLPSELVSYLLKGGIARGEPLIRDTITHWQRQAVAFDSRTREATETKNWLRRIDPELIPAEVRGPGHYGVEADLPQGYETVEDWIASFVALYDAFPSPDLRSFVEAVYRHLAARLKVGKPMCPVMEPAATPARIPLLCGRCRCGAKRLH